jgi:hypothetical protein
MPGLGGMRVRPEPRYILVDNVPPGDVLVRQHEDVRSSGGVLGRRSGWRLDCACCGQTFGAGEVSIDLYGRGSHTEDAVDAAAQRALAHVCALSDRRRRVGSSSERRAHRCRDASYRSVVRRR